MPQTTELNTILDAPPQWELYVLLGMLALGLGMWLLGRKVARPACAVGGLVLGGLCGFALAHSFGLMSWLFVCVTAAGIAGCLLAWFMFRVWMGLSAAVILGLAVPGAVLVWQGVPVAAAEGTEQAEAAEALNEPLQFIDDPAAEEGQAMTPQEQAKAMIAPLLDAIKAMWDEQVAAVRRFWEGLSARGQWTLMIAAAAGASFGLVIGLIAPYFASSVQTSLVGGLLVLAAAIRLSQTHLPGQAGFLPTELRGRLLLLGLITAAGIAVQWTLAAKRTD